MRRALRDRQLSDESQIATSNVKAFAHAEEARNKLGNRLKQLERAAA